MIPNDITDLAQRLVSAYTQSHNKLVTAESCTGGLVGAAITSIPGSSSVFDRGYITYSNESKIEALHVQPDTLKSYGAVSDRTAEEMAQGALNASQADIALSLTGIAGPERDSSEKPIGLVYIGLATRKGMLMHYKCLFRGTREQIRMQSVSEGLKLLLTLVP